MYELVTWFFSDRESTRDKDRDRDKDRERRHRDRDRRDRDRDKDKDKDRSRTRDKVSVLPLDAYLVSFSRETGVLTLRDLDHLYLIGYLYSYRVT